MSLRTSAVAALLAAALASACASPARNALAGAGGAPVVLPAELCRGSFIVPVTFRGPDGEPVTLRFAYDTGSVGGDAMITREAMERVTGQRQHFRAGMLYSGAIGGVDAGWLRTRLAPDGVTLPYGLDGILTVDSLPASLVTLDYPAGEMRIAQGSLPEPDGVSVFSSEGGERSGLALSIGADGVHVRRPADPRPWMNVRLGAQTRRMLIDSGSAFGVDVDDLGAFPTVAPPRVDGTSATVYGRLTTSAARLAEDGALGPHRLERPILQQHVWIAPGDLPGGAPPALPEKLGADVMRHFVWTFDLPNRRVRIERAGAEPIRFDPIVSTGVVFDPAGDALLVREVVRGSAAAGADIRAGDLVTHIDGKPVGELMQSCEALPGRAAGRTQRLTRRRGDSVADVDLPLTTLVE